MAKNLVKRGGTYSVRYVVPVKYRDLLGRSQIWKSTGTGDLRQAEQRKHRIIASIQDDVERAVRRAKEGSLTELTLNRRSPVSIRADAESLWTQVQAGEMNTDDAVEILSNFIEDHLAALKVDPENVPNDRLGYLRDATALVSNPDALPLNRAIDRYLTEHENTWPKKTWNRKQKWLNYFKDWAGNPDLNAVTQRTAGDYMSEVIQPMEASWSTKNWILSALSPFFRWAKRKGLYHASNPWGDMSADIAESKRGTIKQSKRIPWTPKQLKKLAALPEDSPIYQVGMIILHSGMRPEEICQLTTSDINLEDRFLVVKEGKTKHAVRQVPIHSRILPLITSLVEQSEDGWLIPGLEPGGVDNGRYHNLSKVANRWIRANVSKAPGVVFYSLKNTFRTALDNAGVSKSWSNRITGHTQGDLSLNVYSAGPDLEKLREAIETVSFPV